MPTCFATLGLLLALPRALLLSGLVQQNKIFNESLYLHFSTFITVFLVAQYPSCPFGLLLLPTSPPCKLQIFPRSCPLVWRPCISCALCTGTPVGGEHMLRIGAFATCGIVPEQPLYRLLIRYRVFQFSAFKPLTEAVGSTF